MVSLFLRARARPAGRGYLYASDGNGNPFLLLILINLRTISIYKGLSAVATLENITDQRDLFFWN
jgi:hypothetical protein